MTDAFRRVWLLDPQPGFCCQDEYTSRDKPVRLHSGGCPNRCSDRIEVPFARWRRLVAAYPCGYEAGHDGEHWLHPAYRLSAIDPQQVLAALDAAGFVRAGHRTGVYVRFRWPNATGPQDPSLVVPLDRDFADYEDLLVGTLRTLDRAVQVGDEARVALDALGGTRG